jgi:murein DD-endopeptidase MepM/ murein hydrolase activator NlpD
LRAYALALILVGPLALAACIPPSPQHPGATEPRLDGRMDTVFDEDAVWDSNPVQPNAGLVSGSAYVVQPGDTLSQIGEATGVGLEALAAANALEAPYIIKPGQTLAIPQGRFHRVAAGETGIAIARAYGVPWSRIVEVNALTEPFILKIGQRLSIPGTGAAPADADSSRAQAFRLDIDDIVTGGEPASEQEGALVEVAPDTVAAPLPASMRVAEPSQFSGSFGWPATGAVRTRFGPAGEGQINHGIDIAVARRAPVTSASDGVVAFVGDGVTGYGSVILVRHGGGWISAYGRTAEATVTRGQTVKRGQVIGYAGTGSAPLIHFELRKNRLPVDPLTQLPPR